MLTNVEKLMLYVSKHGMDAIEIHKIPQSQFWLIAEPQKEGWKLYVCNPLGTSHRLVTKEPVSDVDYTTFWAKLITTNITEKSITKIAHEYRKQITLTNKTYGPHQHNEERKVSSTRHSPSPKVMQVALTQKRPRSLDGQRQKGCRRTHRISKS